MQYSIVVLHLLEIGCLWYQGQLAITSFGLADLSNRGTIPAVRCLVHKEV